MKEHIEAIQKYMKEKYGIVGNINIYFHQVADDEQAKGIVSDIAKDLGKGFRHNEAPTPDSHYKWYETTAPLNVHVAAFYEKGEENEYHQRVV